MNDKSYCDDCDKPLWQNLDDGSILFGLFQRYLHSWLIARHTVLHIVFSVFQNMGDLQKSQTTWTPFGKCAAVILIPFFLLILTKICHEG